MSTAFLAALFLIAGYAKTAAPQDAAAAEPPKIESGPGLFSFDLDAGSGQFQERHIPAPASAFSVKGLLQFVSVKGNGKWAPMAAVEVEESKGPFFAGLVAFVRPETPDKIDFAVRDERFNDFPSALFGRTQMTRQAIPFEVRLEKSGILQVSVAGKPARAMSVRPFEITRVGLVSSGAHVRFSNVQILSIDH